MGQDEKTMVNDDDDDDDDEDNDTDLHKIPVSRFL